MQLKQPKYIAQHATACYTHPPISFLANPANCLKDPRASSLDDLLSPITTPLPQLVSFLRDATALLGSSLPSMREQQSRGRTKSPRPPSEVSGTVVRALFLLQMLEKDSTPGKESVRMDNINCRRLLNVLNMIAKIRKGTRPTSTGVSILLAAYTILLMCV